MSRGLGQFSALAVGLAIFVAAAAALALEVPYEQLSRTAPQDRGALLASAPFPLSERSDQTLAESCHDVIASTDFAVLPNVRRNETLESCSASMAGLIAKVPDHGLAHLVRAQIAAVRGAADFNALMAESARRAPNSTWLRLGRLDLSLEHEAQLDASGRALEAADIDALLTSADGRAGLARRYLSNARVRDLIAARAAVQSQDIQRLFVAAVRDARGAA